MKYSILVTTVSLLCSAFCTIFGQDEGTYGGTEVTGRGIFRKTTMADVDVPMLRAETCNCSCEFGTEPMTAGVTGRQPLPTYITSTVDVGPITGKDCLCSCDIGDTLHTPEGSVAMVSQSCKCQCNYTVEPDKLWNCDCDYHPGGCRIVTPAPSYYGCKCSYKGAWTCGGELVLCKNNSSPLCQQPSADLQSCLYGGGDCNGYHDAHCDCDYHPGGCRISKVAPSYAACKCIYKGAWTCGGEIVPCSDENSPLCANPTDSVQSCVLGGGDCSGYGDAKCDCDYHPGGCTISKEPPANTACKCSYVGAWTCKGDVVICRDESSPHCKSPAKNHLACVQGGGDCDGYREAKCDCDYHPGGCRISGVAPRYTACKCKYMGAWTCSGEIVSCRDESSRYCQSPDSSIHSCTEGGGDCDGYRDVTCDCDYHPGGCAISKAAPPNTACRCSYKGAWTCGGSVKPCRDFSNPKCINPDKSIQACFQGGGDCEGYHSAQCDCCYHPGGCTVCKAPPPHTACHCSYKGFWTCSGSVRRCRNENAYRCQHPDKSRDTCLQGGGDCDGY